MKVLVAIVLVLGSLQAWVSSRGQTAPIATANQDPAVGALNVAAFPGRDLSAKIANAVARLGKNGGTIEIPIGAYEFSQTIVKPRNVTLRGDGPNTYLEYMGTGIAIQVVDDQGSDSYYPFLGGLENLTIYGQSSSRGVGIYYGCNTGANPHCTDSNSTSLGDNQFCRNVNIHNIGTGIEIGTNAFLLQFTNCSANRAVGVGVMADPANTDASNSGENISFYGGQWVASQVAVRSPGLRFHNSSFDVAPDSAHPTFQDTTIWCFDCHFEATEGSGPMFQTDKGDLLNYFGGEILYDNGRKDPKLRVPEIVLSTGRANNIVMVGMNIAANTPITSILNVSDNAQHTIAQNILYAAAANADAYNPVGGSTIFQPGFEKFQTGVNVIAPSGNYADGVANYYQYGLAGHPFAQVASGSLLLSGIGNNITITPDGGGHRIYINQGALDAATLPFETSSGYKINDNTVLPPSLKGYHGEGGTRTQLSDGTGAVGHFAKFDQQGALTDGGLVQTFIGAVGCTTSGVVLASCAGSSIAWKAPFIDNNYSLTCVMDTDAGAAAGQPIVSSVSHDSGHFRVSITALTATVATGYVNCTAIHL